MAGEYIEFNNNSQPALNDVNINRLQQLIKQDIQGAVSGDTLPIGAIMPFGSDTIPDNWLLCNGQAVSRTTYQELFNTIGITYGSGDGFTTFNLPDLQGKIPVGLDENDTDFDTLGETGGEKEHTLTIDEIPAHTHTGVPKYYRASVVETGTENNSQTGSQGETSSIGGGQAHNILQPYIVQNYIIKAKQSAGVVATVVDTLTSTSATNALSANQGKVLKELLEGTVLYNNSTGTSSNFTLNESSANYRRFVIEAKNIDESAICIVPEIIDPDGKKIPIMTINTGGGYGKTYIGNSTWQISGNTVTKIQSNALTTLNNNGPIQIESYDNVVITKVIGYNY